MVTSSSLRQITREAVREQVTDVALRLFEEHGFEHTTVQAIVDAVGMSERTFFRYFATKDEVVLQPYEQLNAHMSSLLADRPLEEDIWATLTWIFTHSVKHLYDVDAQRSGRMRRLQGVVHQSSTLLASNLRQFDEFQEQLTDALASRQQQHPQQGVDDRLFIRALVGASFANLHAVTSSTHVPEHTEDAVRRLASLMDRMRPRALG